MEQVTINLFSVTELSGLPREKALDFGRRMIDDSFEPSELTAQIQEMVKDKYGIGTDTCYWRLSCCQGDGVAFYGNLDLDVLRQHDGEIDGIVGRLEGLGFHVGVTIGGKNSRYHHWNSMTVDVEIYHSDENIDTETEREELERIILSTLREASREAERFGYDFIDGQKTDECVVDFLEANGYRFRENGTCFTN